MQFVILCFLVGSLSLNAKDQNKKTKDTLALLQPTMSHLAFDFVISEKGINEVVNLNLQNTTLRVSEFTLTLNNIQLDFQEDDVKTTTNIQLKGRINTGFFEQKIDTTATIKNTLHLVVQNSTIDLSINDTTLETNSPLANMAIKAFDLDHLITDQVETALNTLMTPHNSPTAQVTGYINDIISESNIKLLSTEYEFNIRPVPDGLKFSIRMGEEDD